MRTGLTKYEKETIITFNQDESFASIYTCDEAFIRKLDNLVKKDTRITMESEDEHSKTYIVSKKAIKVRLPKVLSEEKRKELILHGRNMSKYLKKHISKQ